jgi:hypothetical protein
LSTKAEELDEKTIEARDLPGKILKMKFIQKTPLRSIDDFEKIVDYFEDGEERTVMVLKHLPTRPSAVQPACFETITQAFYVISDTKIGVIKFLRQDIQKILCSD